MKIIKIDRYRLAYLLDGPQMIYDEDGDWVLHETSSSHIADLEAQLAAAQERERWIPVTDIRPKRGQHVRVMATMEYDGEDHWIAEDGTVLEPGNILEWRELPAAPKEDK